MFFKKVWFIIRAIAISSYHFVQFFEADPQHTLISSPVFVFNVAVRRCGRQQNKDQGRDSKDISKRNMEHGLREVGVVMMPGTAAGAGSHHP